MTDTHPEPVVTFPFHSPEELESYLPYLLARLSHRWSADQNTVLEEEGIQGAKMRILSCLSAFGELTINELSALSVTEQSSASRTVEQLVQSGLAERKISAKDQRVRTVQLTSVGKKKLSEIAPTINGLYQNLVAETDINDLQVCLKVLRNLLFQVKKNPI